MDFLAGLRPKNCRIRLRIARLSDCQDHIPTYRSLLGPLAERSFEKVAWRRLHLCIGQLFFSVPRDEAEFHQRGLSLSVDESEGVNPVVGAVGIARRRIVFR